MPLNKYKANISKKNINEVLAILLSSTKSKKRPISLIDMSKWLDLAINKLGSYKEVADRLGLSTKMLRQFTFVTRLHYNVQKLFESRRLDSVDAVAHLLALSGREQVFVANILANKKIDTKDLRAIVQFRKRNPSISISKVVDRVMGSKTKKYYIAEFIIRENNSYTKIMNKFKKYITPNEIIRLDIEGVIGRLVLTKNGKQELYQSAKKLKTCLKDVISTILYR